VQSRLCPQLGCLTRETAFTEDMEDEIISNDDSTYLLKTHNFYKKIREERPLNVCFMAISYLIGVCIDFNIDISYH